MSECLTLENCGGRWRRRITALLKKHGLPWLPGVPEDARRYVAAVFFLPLWARGEERFVYILSRSARPNLTYRGGASNPWFKEAREEVYADECVKVFLAIAGTSWSINNRKYRLQRKAGIPRALSGQDPAPPPWLNDYAYSQDMFSPKTPKQLRAQGKKGAARFKELMATNAEFRARFYENRRKGRARFKAKWKADPEFRKRHTEAVKKGLARRVKK